jgi:hypothetical protein
MKRPAKARGIHDVSSQHEHTTDQKRITERIVGPNRVGNGSKKGGNGHLLGNWNDVRIKQNGFNAKPEN